MRSDRFGAAVRELLRERGESANSAAAAIGVVRNTLVSWLDGKVPPDPLRLADLAGFLGVSHAYLLQLTDYLPPELRSAGFHLNAASEARRSFLALADYAQSIADEIAHPGALRVASALLQAQDWQVTLRPSLRGERRRVLLQTYVGIHPLHLSVGLERDRQRVLEALGPLREMYSVTWREQEAHDWPDHPALLLQVPEHERSRPPSPRRLATVPDILFLGTPYAHAETAAACVADSLGYGYSDLRHSVEAALLPGGLERAALAAARRCLSMPERQDTVTSIAFPHVVEAMAAQLVAAPPGACAYLRADDALLEAGARIWRRPLSEMKVARDALDQLTESLVTPHLTIPVSLDNVTQNVSNALFDQAQDAADTFLDWLISEGLLPPSTQWFPVGARLSPKSG